MNFKKIIAVVVDLGEKLNTDSLKTITKSLSVDLKIIDAKYEFAENSVIPAIQEEAKYLGLFPVSSSLSRPVIAKKALEVAYVNNCDIVLHTANQSQNSLRRLNGAIKSLGFQGYYGSPYEYTAITRAEKALFIKKCGFHFLSNRKLSGDANLWCREYESGILDNPESFELDENEYKWSVFPKESHKDKIKITFQKGIPTHIDDDKMSIVDLIENLNYRVGLSGAGRYYGLKHLENQEKVLEVREAPAASILMDTYKDLEMSILKTPLLVQKQHMGQIWTQEAVEGRWYGEVAESAYSFISKHAHKITGSVTYKLLTGGFYPISIVAENPLYLTDRDNWEIKKAKSESQKNITIKSILNDSEIENSIEYKKFACIKGENLLNCWNFFDYKEWVTFSDFWNNLEQGYYMADGGKYRYRRYSKFLYNNKTRILELLPHDSYIQPSYINHLNGDIERVYEPLENDMVNTPFLKGYLQWMADIFSKVSSHDIWIIKLHPYRIAANTSAWKPTPEGIHRDGVNFVTSLLINRENIKGGISSVYDLEENSITNFEMNDICDLCIFDDKYIKHEVSEITAIENDKSAFRDVLVAAFEKD